MIGISWISFEIFLSLDKDISSVIMLPTFSVTWLFLRWDDISKHTFNIFLASEETEDISYVLTIISPISSKQFLRRFWAIYDLVLMLLIFFCKFITFSSIDIRAL